MCLHVAYGPLFPTPPAESPSIQWNLEMDTRTQNTSLRDRLTSAYSTAVQLGGEPAAIAARIASNPEDAQRAAAVVALLAAEGGALLNALRDSALLTHVVDPDLQGAVGVVLPQPVVDGATDLDDLRSLIEKSIAFIDANPDYGREPA